jgi:hypothetical protein
MAKQDKQNRKGAVGGAQEHEEGQHGKVSMDALNQPRNADGTHHHELGKREANDPNRHGKHSDEAAAHHEHEIGASEHDGKHRLFEERKQHDEAERNSDKNRIIKDVAKHHHDPEQFQIPGGRDVHPELGKDGPDETLMSPGKGGGKRAGNDGGRSGGK